MRSDVLLRRVLLPAILVVVFAAGMIIGQNKFGQPKTVIHLVTLKWKATSTPAQQQAAIEGIKGMATRHQEYLDQADTDSATRQPGQLRHRVRR